MKKLTYDTAENYMISKSNLKDGAYYKIDEWLNGTTRQSPAYTTYAKFDKRAWKLAKLAFANHLYIGVYGSSAFFMLMGDEYYTQQSIRSASIVEISESEYLLEILSNNV